MLFIQMLKTEHYLKRKKNNNIKRLRIRHMKKEVFFSFGTTISDQYLYCTLKWISWLIMTKYEYQQVDNYSQ